MCWALCVMMTCSILYSASVIVRRSNDKTTNDFDDDDDDDFNNMSLIPCQICV